MSDRVKRSFVRIQKALQEDSIFFILNALVIKFFDRTIGYWYFKSVGVSKQFMFRGKKFHYFCQRYNKTWRTERAVEIPIVWDIVQEYQGKPILEVGNVLSHYFPVSHDIVDKYEHATGVMNEDVVSYSPSKKYDLIVSISTLEHVGWDETPRNPEKVLLAFENLKQCLAPNGKLVVTLPIGYNPELDKFLADDRIKLSEMVSLKRISANHWTEVNWSEIQNTRYHYLLFYPEGLAVAIFNKE